MNAVRMLFLPLLFICLSFPHGLSAAEVKDVVLSMETQLSRASGDSEMLKKALSKIQKDLYELNPLEFNVYIEQKSLNENVARLFVLKKSLRFSLNSLPDDSAEKERLSESVKTVLSSIRYLEDYLFELLQQTLTLKIDTKKILPFSDNDIFVQHDRSFRNKIASLKTGDVLLMRGTAFSSAMISRVGEAPLTYSHMAMVYLDPANGKPYIIESMLNSGFKKTELKPEHFKDQARVSVYRSKDIELAKKAGEFGNAQYENGIKTGKPLEYDITMGLEENCKYYCSKFVSWAYNSVAKKTIIPEYPSRLLNKNRNYALSLGIPTSSTYTFSPADIDLDTTFDFVYEYRNPNMTTALHMDDLIVDKMLYWLRTENLEVVPSHTMDTAASVIMTLAKRPFVQRFINKLNIHINKDLDPKHLAILGASTLLMMKFKRAIMPQYKAYLDANGQPMSPKEIYALIERIRKDKPSLTKHLKPRSIDNMCLRFFAGT